MFDVVLYICKKEKKRKAEEKSNGIKTWKKNWNKRSRKGHQTHVFQRRLLPCRRTEYSRRHVAKTESRIRIVQRREKSSVVEAVNGPTDGAHPPNNGRSVECTSPHRSHRG